MEQIRKPFQGVWNVLRFNWHFYLFASAFVLFILAIGFVFPDLKIYLIIISFAVFLTTLISISVSFYVYDLSNLYSFYWIDNGAGKTKIVNINAGFDETSHLFKEKFKDSEMVVLDFYDSKKHTEVSIKRARKAYPPFPQTKQISTNTVPLKTSSADKIFAVLSVHEIREGAERSRFFQELHRVLKDNGEIIVVEHLRDLPNFLAYNVGFFHFHSKKSWLENFQSANLKVEKELKITPFISAFILTKI